ncbi:MAG: hypothetical protein H8D23_27215 [Candidatus Brocadiales bacterium]|nr:hypothetical protein [Candidatus Brocadiales bacterium]
MKVYIGPYPNWIQSKVHDRHMDKVYGYDWPAESKYTTKDRMSARLESVLQTIYNYTVNQYYNRKKQKVKVRIDNHDTWSMDSTLSLIIEPMLRQLKETNHGAPYVDDDDVPEELKSTSAPPKENDWDTDDKHFKRWDWVMDEMIWAFNQSNTDWEDQFHTGESDYDFVPVDQDGNDVPEEEAKLFELKRTPEDTSNFDFDGYKAHQKRMQNGFRMFGRYYQNLWD